MQPAVHLRHLRMVELREACDLTAQCIHQAERATQLAVSAKILHSDNTHKRPYKRNYEIERLEIHVF